MMKGNNATISSLLEASLWHASLQDQASVAQQKAMCWRARSWDCS